MKKSLILIFILLSNLAFGAIQEGDLKKWTANFQELFNNGTLREFEGMLADDCVMGWIDVQKDGTEKYYTSTRAQILEGFSNRHNKDKAIFDFKIISVKVTRDDKDYGTIVLNTKMTYQNLKETHRSIDTVILVETPYGLKIKRLIQKTEP